MRYIFYKIKFWIKCRKFIPKKEIPFHDGEMILSRDQLKMLFNREKDMRGEE